MYTKVVNYKEDIVDIRELIIKILNEKGKVRLADIVKATGFSRAYINRFFQKLREEGKIVLLGKANKAHYIFATSDSIIRAKKGITEVHRILHNHNVFEDVIYNEIKKDSEILTDLPKNISNILYYAFTEMLNNAIEHSKSEIIKINMEKDDKWIRFDVIDEGVGIFNNIMKKKNLNNIMEAIQDLLKGKLSTLSEAHSGEGIFFTSKAADTFIIQSSNKKIVFSNLIEELFIKDIKNINGTKINFSIGFDSKRDLREIFKKYTDGALEFNKTEVTIKLYKIDTEYISRSQARRVLSGLDQFKTIMLDFKDINTLGQGFADEVFRVWRNQHPEINIVTKNANDNVSFMINRVAS